MRPCPSPMPENHEINSYRYCCYRNCSSDKITTRDGAITFFRFPIMDTERCSIWITNVGRENFIYLTPKELKKKGICEFHFKDSMFVNPLKTHLKKHAVPIPWKNDEPELIEIDDDEDDESGDGSNNDTNELVHAISSIGGSENRLPINVVVENALNSAVIDNRNILRGALLNEDSIPRCSASPPLNTPSTDKQSRVITSTVEESLCRPIISQTGPANESEMNVDQTKFHNLPPNTTQTDFYYQHCTESAEETNHSMPELPDGELPLFVQQNSVISLADEQANSDISESVYKKRRVDREGDNNLSEQLKNAVKQIKSLSSLLFNNEDEFDLFGKSVALQLKKMSLCTALEVQAKIQTLMSQYRIKDIQKEARDRLVSASSRTCSSVQQETIRVEPEINISVDEEVLNLEGRESGKENVDKDKNSSNSPQLFLTCVSEHSDVENTE